MGLSGDSITILRINKHFLGSAEEASGRCRTVMFLIAGGGA